MSLYKITELLGYLAILFAAFYALVGLIQLIKRKGLLKVDKEIIITGIFYALVILVYIFFEKVVINYRPVLIDGELEASYPSSHTLLALCICASSIIASKRIFKPDAAKYMNIIAYILCIAIVLGRTISGVHWITDILGGIIISAALLSIYYNVMDHFSNKK